ncbi:MAG: D-sedoheptulose 7-phosphate isomerase [Pseudoalteromonas tetraodonis]|jgi:D-sedoheptulose 7-phosphate isomerase
MSQFNEIIDASVAAIKSLRGIESEFEAACALLVESLQSGGKVMACGNGGSAADSAHFMTELLCRLDVERPPLAGIALTNDGSFLTAVGNDYAFDEIFARQITGLGNSGDVVIGMTTSGNSGNILRAFAAAKEKGVKTIAMLGGTGGAAAGVADVDLIVPVEATARIQEAHQVLIHLICGNIQEAIFDLS